MKIGITGNSGFIGTHLTNYITYKSSHEIIEFHKSYFNSDILLDQFVSNCDVIIHLAGMNRSESEELLFNVNIDLTDKLIRSLTRTNSKPHIIFSSSIQESQDNIYGKSKNLSRLKFIEYTIYNGLRFTGLVIPNVYGPFCKPFYNSVISTFSYQLINNLTTQIHYDSKLNLIYIDELIENIINVLENEITDDQLFLTPTTIISVYDLLDKLNLFHKLYIEHGIIPNLTSSFSINLFNTFRSYINYEKYFPKLYTSNKDSRGNFTELLKIDNAKNSQISFSTTFSQVTRGNHFHTRKIERFSVIKGDAIIRLRKIGDDKILEYKISGDTPMYVDIPVWTTHNITNIGNNELYTIFWINEFYNPSDADTFFENV